MLFKNCQWNTDWEGVHGFNDMAMEITREFHPEGKKAGEEFFAKISKIDDWWALTKKGYRAGTTLVLILPFLKAWGVTDAKMQGYAASHLRLIPGSKNTLSSMRKIMPVFIVSTTLSPCMEPVIKMCGISKENLYCTQVSLDIYQFNRAEIRQIKRFEKEISKMPILDWPGNTAKESNLPQEMQKVARGFNQIFWKKAGLMGMNAYQKMIKEIKIIGGPGKAEAVKDSCQRTGNPPSRVAYTGDSITDVQALKLVRENGGLAISANGNRYALGAAEIACMLEHTIILEVLLLAFAKGGKDLVINTVQNWSWQALERLNLEKSLFEPKIEMIHLIYPKSLPRVEIVTEKSLDSLIEQSEAFRKYLRGEVIGKLG